MNYQRFTVEDLRGFIVSRSPGHPELPSSTEKSDLICNLRELDSHFERFMRLPKGARLDVYRCLLARERPRSPSPLAPLEVRYLSILRTCHAMYDEALDILYEDNVVDVTINVPDNDYKDDASLRDDPDELIGHRDHVAFGKNPDVFVGRRSYRLKRLWQCEEIQPHMCSIIADLPAVALRKARHLEINIKSATSVLSCRILYALACILQTKSELLTVDVYSSCRRIPGLEYWYAGTEEMIAKAELVYHALYPLRRLVWCGPKGKTVMTLHGFPAEVERRLESHFKEDPLLPMDGVDKIQDYIQRYHSVKELISKAGEGHEYLGMLSLACEGAWRVLDRGRIIDYSRDHEIRIVHPLWRGSLKSW